MITLNPYITFPGNAREAMEFYADVFGGSLHLDTYDAFPGPELTDADMTLIMHAHLDTPLGLTLMGADLPAAMEYEPGARIQISLSGRTADEEPLREYWARLAEAGTILTPLETAPWGAMFGALTDMFGINWYVNIGDPQD